MVQYLDSEVRFPGDISVVEMRVLHGVEGQGGGEHQDAGGDQQEDLETRFIIKGWGVISSEPSFTEGLA